MIDPLFLQEVGIGEAFTPAFAGFTVDLIQVLREVRSSIFSCLFNC